MQPDMGTILILKSKSWFDFDFNPLLPNVPQWERLAKILILN